MEYIVEAIKSIANFETLLLMLFGTVFGTIAGAIPGITVNLAVIIALPITFFLDPVCAIAFLISIYKSGTYGGSISSILLGTPGTPAAAATAIEGYPLMKQGKAGKALKMALFASVTADLLSNFSLIFFASIIAKLAIKFGPPQYAALMLFALIVVGGISGRNKIKGFLSIVIGLAFSVIGAAPIDGTERFTFGFTYLYGGIPFIPMMIGLFAISEVLAEYSNHRSGHAMSGIELEKTFDMNFPLKEFFQHIGVIVKSAIIGIFIGALPGSGSAVASFVSYSEAKRASKHPEEYGRGSLEGLAACESANNGVCGAAMIPLLTLGIPGDSVTAIMFSALMLQGVIPGPRVFEDNPVIVNGIFVSLFISSLMMLLVGLVIIRISVNILRVRKNVLFPIVLVLCVIGSYAVSGRFQDVLVAALFGLIGLIFKKIDIPVAPVIVAMILSPTLESSIRQSLIMSDGNPIIFINNPINIFFFLLTFVFVIFFIKQEKAAS